ncbi:MAG: Mut7-C RNAse domain-containing protein [Thermodesulfobacteriota bacterium]
MKFLVDRMLGQLVKGLRMLGYDTLYYRGNDPHQLFHLAREEGRVILTRNSKLIPKRPGDQVLRIREDHPWAQLKELIEKKWVTLNEEILFSRCLLCNSLLEKVSRGEAEGRVPEFIFYHHEHFLRCPKCLKFYWPGSHQEKMHRRIEELFRGGS